MATVTILPETTKNPITLIGQRAGICWGADISDPKKNYERGLWSASMVKMAVKKGIITKEQYKEITGKAY